MDIPREFNDICGRFHQDVALIHDNSQTAIDTAVAQSSDMQGKVALSFLNELLSGQYTSEEIQSVWWQTSADITFRRDDDLILFLEFLRDALV